MIENKSKILLNENDKNMLMQLMKTDELDMLRFMEILLFSGGDNRISALLKQTEKLYLNKQFTGDNGYLKKREQLLENFGIISKTPKIKVIDKRTNSISLSSEYNDFVHCLTCNAYMLVNANETECPICKQESLEWADKYEKTVNTIFFKDNDKYVLI